MFFSRVHRLTIWQQLLYSGLMIFQPCIFLHGFIPLSFLVLWYISSLEAQLSSYEGGGSSGAWGRGSGGAGGGAGSGSGGSGGGGSLEESIPGVPGEDYPIYATVPDTGFTCDGQVIPDISLSVIYRVIIAGRGW